MYPAVFTKYLQHKYCMYPAVSLSIFNTGLLASHPIIGLLFVHHPSERLLILKPTIIILKREHQQILRLPAPIYEIQISHFAALLSPNLRVVKLKPSQRI